AAPESLGGLPRPDQALVVEGEPLFLNNCATCHGVKGRGDGEQAGVGGLVPANLTVSHARLHSDADLANWIRNGIEGTKMPGFADLSDGEVSAIVAYVRELQWDAYKTADAPGAEGCTVAPRTLTSIESLPAATPAAVPGSADATAEAGGAPVSDAEFAAIRGVVRELVACTNAGDIMRRLALYSDEKVAQAYPTGPTTALERIAGTPFPVLQEERVALLDIKDARKLPDGRVAARVTIDNPQFHTHGPVTPTANKQT
ncbi:MAG: c-type cytochrome, partial [Thermomicrobiales bacterium]